MWDDANGTVPDRFHCGLGKRLGFDEPLLGDIRFHHRAAPITMSDRMHMVFDAGEQVALLQIFYQMLAAGHAIHPLVGWPRFFVHGAVWVHHVDGVELVAAPQFKVVGVMCGSDFQRA